MSGRAPLSAKVTSGTGLGTAVGLVTWALTTFIPAWHAGLPPQLDTALPLLVGAVGYFAGGYLATHKATPGEIAAAVSDAKQVLALTGKQQATVRHADD